jgi:hypothetical protein
MTWIRIEPGELTTTADTLRTTAAGLCDVALDTVACCACAMPPEVATLAHDVTAAVRSGVEALAGELHGDANDLVTRAVLAASDSTVTAASAAWGTGTHLGGTTVGGSSSGWQLVDPTGAPTSLAAVLGGAVVGGTPAGYAAPVLGGGTVVGGSWSSTSTDGLLAAGAWPARPPATVRPAPNVSSDPIARVQAGIMGNQLFHGLHAGTLSLLSPSPLLAPGGIGFG